LSDPDDGVIERSRGQLPSGNNQGHKTGWCHSSGMRDPAQTTDNARNAVMNNNAAVSSIDLVVESPGVSDSSPPSGQAFTAYATVRNTGSSGSAGTTLRFYRSDDASITSSDDEFSTQAVGGLTPGATSAMSATGVINELEIFWIGACVDPVVAELDPGNNCSSGVQVVVQPSCSFTITPTTISFGHLGGAGSISLNASDPSCNWNATESLDWVNSLSPTSGTGNDTVEYTVLQNTGNSRSGTLTVAGQTMTLNQVGPDATVGPFTVVDVSVDDDSAGDSTGNGNGIAECGETIELYVRLQNQGSTGAQDVNATLTSSDPFFGGFLGNSSSEYPDIDAGSMGLNSNDFEFGLPADMPDGHTIHFDISTTTFASGPWSDTLTIDVSCADVCDAPFSLTVTDESISGRQAFGACQNVSLGMDTEVLPGGQLILIAENSVDLMKGSTIGQGAEVSAITGSYPGTVCYPDPVCGAGGEFEVMHYPSGVCLPLADCDLVWKCPEGPLNGTCNGGVTDCEVSPGCPDGVQTCSSGACTTIGMCADLIKMEGFSWNPNYNQCSCAETSQVIGSCSP